MAPRLVLGSDPSRCDLVAERRTISTQHAAIELGDDEGLVLIDLGSTNGTFLNGARVAPDAPQALRLGDEIALGKRLTFVLESRHVAPLYDPSVVRRARPIVEAPKPPRADPNTAVLTDADLARAIAERAADAPEPAEGATEEPPAPSPTTPSLSLGYAAANDVVVRHPVVSGRHARIYALADGRYLIEDRGSTNGTWVGGARVRRGWLRPGDAFSLGSHQLVFDEEMVGRLVGGDAADDAVDVVPFAAGRVLRLGRAPECDVVIDAPTVSGQHATLTVLPDRSAYLLEDAGSTNGTYLDNRANTVTSGVRAGVDDVIFLGSYRLPLSRLPDLITRDAPSTAGVGRFVIGRDAGADITIDAPVVSSRHAEVEVTQSGRFVVRDLGSSNGTFLNGVRVSGSAEASTEDRLSLGGYEMRFDRERGVVRREYQGDIMLQAEHVSVRVEGARGATKPVLNDVSFTVYPTEFVGLLGPSGAGKTTLMMALAGLLPPSGGRSVINGLDLYESYDAFRGNVGYVPQDDIVFPELTVYESLFYTARLRLPPDTTVDEIDAKISAVLAALEITHTRDTRIGDALRKGISGGERKRVNLAQELITEPALLFLDEPTSGLASQDTINVMRLLRSLADGGKTILMTIHQPSLDAYRLMDNVVYLFRGNVVYFGPAYPDSILHLNDDVPEGPARDALLADPGNAMKPIVEEQRAALSASGDAAGAVEKVVARRRREYERSGYHREYVAERARGASRVSVPAGARKTGQRGVLRQAAVLTARAARIRWRDAAGTAILLAQAPIIAAVLSLVFSHGGDPFDLLRRGPAALFLLVTSAIWFGCSNAARDIVGEQAVYRRERMVNLLIPAYVASKLAVLAAVCAIQCLVLLAICYVPIGLSGSPLALYGVLFASSMVGSAMGLCLSAVVRSQEAAVALVPILLIPQIILGGVIIPVHEMGGLSRGLASLTAARWGYEAALHVEFGDDDPASVRARCEIPECSWGPAGQGVAFVYYPSDPDAALPEEERSGIVALAETPPPPVLPRAESLCRAYCPSLADGDPITPIERALGADPTDPERVRAVARMARAGSYSDIPVLSSSRARGAGYALGALAGFFAFFAALVSAVLRYRDVEVE